MPMARVSFCCQHASSAVGFFEICSLAWLASLLRSRLSGRKTAAKETNGSLARTLVSNSTSTDGSHCRSCLSATVLIFSVDSVRLEKERSKILT